MFARWIWTFSKIETDRQEDQESNQRGEAEEGKPQDSSFRFRFVMDHKTNKRDSQRDGRRHPVERVAPPRRHSRAMPDEFAPPEARHQLRPEIFCAGGCKDRV